MGETRRNTRRYKTRRGTRQSLCGDDEDGEGGGMCFVVVFSIRLYLIIDYTYITLYLLSFSHFISSLVLSIPLSLNPFNSFKDFPRPPLLGYPSSASLMLVPPPPGVGGAGVDDDCVAGVNDWSGRGCGVCRSFAFRLIRYLVMISKRGRRLRLAMMWR